MGLRQDTTNDKQDQAQRLAELRRQLVNLNRLTRAQVAAVEGNFVTLQPAILFPLETWEQLQTHERRWLKALAVGLTSTAAVLVGRSAARMHGMWVINLTPEPVELCLPSRGVSPSRRKDSDFTYRRMRLVSGEVETVNGLRVTTLFRTFADIARFHDFEEGLVAADYLMRNGMNRETMSWHAARLRRLHRVSTVRECIEHAVDNSESAYESLARAHLIRAGIGPLTTQFEVAGYFADILVEDWLIIEIDGRVKYQGSDAEAVRQREFERQKRIGNLGYVFLRFTPQFIRDSPKLFVKQVRAALAARGRVVSGG